MSNKKNIDRLYQEKFKDFEATPHKRVWKNIEQELKKDKKRRVIPIFWYKTAGVAAAIALLIFLGDTLFEPEQVEIVNSSNPKEETLKDESVPSLKNTVINKSKESSVSLQENDKLKTEIKIAETSPSTTPKKENNTDFYSQQESVKKSNKRFNSYNSAHENKTQNIAQTNHASAEAKTKKNLLETTENFKEETDFNQDGNLKLDNTNLAATVINKDSTLTKENLEKENALAQREKELKEENNDEKEDDETESFARWNIRPNVSPVYYGNLSDSGSPIDPQFSNNNASGEVSMAYGVNFAYAVSKKLKVRTGVSRVKLNYSTNDVAFTSSVEPMNLSGVNSNARTKNIQVVSARPSGNQDQSIQGRNINPYTSGALKQQVGFIEVPLEIEYAILDKRFGIHLIGGASSLILNENEVAISSSEGVTNLGKANNLNSVSFSTNLGVGLGYEISEKLDFNVEPTFKYQLNTFSGNTNGFKPYYFGIYTGLNFKF
ncbi:outer membrane protein with beta-barrel domain [Mesonia algae]|uniref:Outer membrane protein with beta-barrel domain n=1 Tax=Mesonia algae TaxID=213248 RepID=A0A2W7IDE8_9FLAO|nr:outer membrane beta-barrel protein [Mesonia algae]PZW44108.1 outer membrane protein with beta-barrel domain [Mesonia algae]